MLLRSSLFSRQKMLTARGSPIFCLSGRASDESRERRGWFRPTIFLTPGAKGVNMSVISARVRWMSDLSLHCARSRILLWQSAGDTGASGKQLGFPAAVGEEPPTWKTLACALIHLADVCIHPVWYLSLLYTSIYKHFFNRIFLSF